MDNNNGHNRPGKQPRIPTVMQLEKRVENVPPCDRDAERAVIGSMLIDPRALTIAVNDLTPDDFYSPRERLLFQTITEMAQTEQPADELTLVSLLKTKGILADVGGPENIGAIIDSTPSAARVEAYCGIVKARTFDREALLQAYHLVEAARLGKGREALEQMQPVALTGELFQPAGEFCAKNASLRAPVIFGLLRKGEIANIIAPPKMGKSWLVDDLALATCTGKRWLKFDTAPGRVLLVDNELHPETLADRIPRIAEARGLRPEDWAHGLCIHSLRGRLVDLFALEGYFRTLPRTGFSLIILDAFYRFLPLHTDENDNGTVANLYNVLDRCAARLDAAFILIHHTSKGVQAAKAITDVGSGAGSQSRAADCHIILRQHEEPDCLVLEAVCRSWPSPEALVLRRNFPLWIPADELDPNKLAQTSAPRAKPVTADDILAVVTETPQTREHVIEAAMQRTQRGEKAVRAAFNEVLQANLLKTERLPRPHTNPIVRYFK